MSYEHAISSPVIALCGPSGVGKGHTKHRIKARLEDQVKFGEPIVCTTRPARSDDGPSRRAGMGEAAFEGLVENGSIVLAHRPFRDPHTPRYGFDRNSVADGQPLLTEVHSSILPEFKHYFRQRPVLIIGLVALEATLLGNISTRGDNPDTDHTDLRMTMAALEYQELQDSHSMGIIDHLVNCDLNERESAQQFVVEAVRGYLGVL